MSVAGIEWLRPREVEMGYTGQRAPLLPPGTEGRRAVPIDPCIRDEAYTAVVTGEVARLAACCYEVPVGGRLDLLSGLYYVQLAHDWPAVVDASLDQLSGSYPDLGQVATEAQRRPRPTARIPQVPALVHRSGGLSDRAFGWAFGAAIGGLLALFVVGALLQ